MSLSRRAFERLIILNTAIWIVVLVVGASVLERSRSSITAALAPIGDELGGWTGLVLGELAPGAEPLARYELRIAPRVLRAAALSTPRASTWPSAGEAPWFPATLVAGEREFSVEAQLAPEGAGDRFEARAWRLRFDSESTQAGVQEIALAPASAKRHSGALLARDLARGLGLLAPPGGFVRLQINGVEAGPFFWSEAIRSTTFARLGVPSGEILTPAGGRARVPRTLIGASDDALALAAYDVANATDASEERGPAKLERLLRLTRHADDATFAAEVPQLLNVEQYLRWNALTWLFGDAEADAFLALAWYFDPVTGLLEPSVDELAVAGRAGDLARIDSRDASRLGERLLEIPEYRQERNQVLWQLAAASENDLVGDADDRLGELLVPLARSRGAFGRLQELADVRRDTRETLKRNAARFRSAVVAARVDAEAVRTTPQHSARLALDLEPHGLADLELTEIHFDVGSLGAVGQGEATLVLRDPAGEVVSRETLTPDESGSSVVLRPRSTVLAPWSSRLLDGRTTWRAEIELPFFRTAQWQRPGFLERVELRYRNSITRHRLAPSELFFRSETPAAGDDAAVARTLEWPTTLRNAGRPFRVDGDELVLAAGDHRLDHSLVVPARFRLRFEAGARLHLAPDVSIYTLRGIRADGSEDAPVELRAQDPARPFGAVAVVRAAEASNLQHVVVSGGSEATFQGIAFTGQLAFHAADAILRHVEVREGAADGLSLQRSRFDIAHSRFVENVGDGTDAGWSQGSVSNSLFSSNGDDGLDLGTSEVSVARSEFRTMRDKGVSVGERSVLTLVRSDVLDSDIGVAAKEDSRAALIETDVRGNRLGVALYRDNPAYGDGYASVTGGTFSGNVEDWQVSPGSEIELAQVRRERENTIARSVSVFLSSLAASGAR